MNLTKHSNLYAYFISHIQTHGTETLLKYSRRDKQYTVVKLVDFMVIDQFSSNSAYIAKGVFRRWL